MKKNGLKQDELAKKLSVAPSTIGMYERNMREPNNEVVVKLASFFDVSTDYLLGNSNNRKKYTHTDGTLIGKVASKIEKMDAEELELFNTIIDKITKDKN